MQTNMYNENWRVVDRFDLTASEGSLPRVIGVHPLPGIHLLLLEPPRKRVSVHSFVLSLLLPRNNKFIEKVHWKN